MSRLRPLLVLALLVFVVILPLGQFLVAYATVPRQLSRMYGAMPMPVDVRHMGVRRVKWLLAVQDPNFFRHPGVDFFTPGSYATITDGLVKDLCFDRFSPGFLGWRAARENLIALAFDRRVPKMEQLRLFVNTVYLGTENGREVRGFDRAAHIYFNKSYSAINDEEYLRLVAMILMPGKYHVVRQKENNNRRVLRIQRLLEGNCSPLGHGDVEYPDCEVTSL